jgi:hypothetical protein
VNGRVILNCVKKQCQINLPWSRGSSLVPQVDSSEYGNEYLDSINSGKFYNYNINYSLFKANSAHSSETEHKKHIQGGFLP